GKALFEANSVSSVTIDGVADEAPDGLVHSLAIENGTDPFDITFRQTLDEVHIENHSAKNLILDDIAVVNTTEMPDVTITADSVAFDADPSPFNEDIQDAFGFDIVQNFGSTQIDVLQLTPFSSADILVGGTIDNPIGATNLLNQGGNVVAGIGSLV